MGNWNVTIQGVGQHHNNSPNDVETITKEFVDRLVKAGHNIESAFVTTGSKIEIEKGDRNGI